MARNLISEELMKLSIEQIREVQSRYKVLHPEDRTLQLECAIAIGTKRTEQNMRDFVALIEDVKNAP